MILNRYFNQIIYITSALFIALNALFLYLELYWFTLIPIALLMVFLAFFAIDKLFLFIVFMTPFSLNLENLELGGIGMYLPTEPLMFGIMLIIMLRLIWDKKVDRTPLKHPVTIALAFNICWLIVTAITSELPLVSLKFVVARLWFILSIYYLGIFMFQRFKNIERFFWLFLVPLTIVIGYTIYRHYTFGFTSDASHWVMWPFFKDHTSYGAILVMIFPILFYFLRKPQLPVRFLAGSLIVIFAIAIVLSYTRAAWLSLLAAVGVYFLYKLNVKFKYVFSLGVLALFVLAINWNQLMIKLNKNRQDSSVKFSEHIQSMSNVSTDASNLERINRWEAAIKMFKERPVLGWGPGTYAFLYAPFQHSGSKTIISTNAGNRGNAHSEYIGPLAESGVLGSISFILIVIAIYVSASNLYHRVKIPEIKELVLLIICGLTTYLTHGFLNNYLDTDKASVPFWGMVAILISIEIYHKKLLIEPESE